MVIYIFHHETARSDLHRWSRKILWGDIMKFLINIKAFIKGCELQNSMDKKIKKNFKCLVIK